MKVYLVYYETGEYEDTQKSIDAAFFSQEKAEYYAKERNDFLEEHECSYSGDVHPHTDRDSIAELYKEKFNDTIYIDYTGGEFYVRDIDVQ